ncbi:MAG: S-methyl-5-thioribose-1-phosphate isomerase [Methanoregula sp.]|nr:S-methyl-5-thioribose-1-phosphate isomerase [Methanoregula sp.]
MNGTATLWWDTGTENLRYIDQTLLPEKYTIVECQSVNRLAEAIRRLEIRGAPALGVAGAYGIALSTRACRKNDLHTFFAEVHKDAEILRATRPTAINLGWGIDRVLSKILPVRNIPSARRIALEEADAVAREDTACCHAIGSHGAALLADTCTVLTHCNAGSLACSSWGTALGVIRSAVRGGKQVDVIACETRPLLQGSRLTAWELIRDGIDVTVITDSSAAHLMRTGTIDAVIVGADRITRDAVFNKIGTYMHAVCARYHNIPFYVAAPLSTFDTQKSEGEVIIEERDRDEVTTMGCRVYVPDAAVVKNYAFDATPMNLVTAIITEQGVMHPPIAIDSILSFKSTK